MKRRNTQLLKYLGLVRYWPGGSYLVMNSNPRVPGGIPLLAVGYKYNYRVVLGFITTEGAGSTEPGDPHLSRIPDIFLVFLFVMLFSLT